MQNASVYLAHNWLSGASQRYRNMTHTETLTGTREMSSSCHYRDYVDETCVLGAAVVAQLPVEKRVEWRRGNSQSIGEQ